MFLTLENMNHICATLNHLHPLILKCEAIAVGLYLKLVDFFFPYCQGQRVTSAPL